MSDLHARGVLNDEEYRIRRSLILNDTAQPQQKSGGVAVLVLALIGAVFGVMTGLIAMSVGGIGNAVTEGSGNQMVGLGVSAILACAFATICAGVYFSGRKRTLMSWGLLVAAIWHVVSISYFGIPGFVFILLASIFAWFGRKH